MQRMHTDWKLHRGLIAHAFEFAHLKPMSKTMVDTCLAAVDRLEQHVVGHGETDVLVVMKQLTLDVIGLTAFGLEFDNVKRIGQGSSEYMHEFEYLLAEYVWLILDGTMHMYVTGFVDSILLFTYTGPRADLTR